MSRDRFRSLALLASVIAAAMVLWIPAAHALSGNGKIAYASHYVDGTEDIYVMNADGTNDVRLTPVNAIDDNYPSWSPDGSKVAFASRRDGNWEIYVMNADGTGQTRLTTDPGDDKEPAWSPDGTGIAFTASRPNPHIWVMNPDGSSQTQVSTSLYGEHDASWSPGGTKLAFQGCTGSCSSADVLTINIDGTGQQNVTQTGVRMEREPAWAPDGSTIAFAARDGIPSNIYLIPPSGGQETQITFSDSGGTEYLEPAWSPDASKIVANKFGQLVTMNPDGTNESRILNVNGNESNPAWQPVPQSGYPRPKGATPLRVPLVPAYQPCTSPDRTHGPPIAFGSCAGPQQTSPYLTVGTPDANGASPNSIGSISFQVIAGAPGQPGDSGVELYGNVTDVRCKPGAAPCGPPNMTGGADYAGEVQINVGVRITDKWNGVSTGGGIDPATLVEVPLLMSRPCSATASTTVGSTCSFQTSLESYYPGFSKDGKREIVQLDSVRVYDGGADGDADTAGNSPFLSQGVFVP